ncbi:hypothetical protein [Allocoleopsis franciscana]|uniref:hypothetical protein n=1 Tax=Allocoleopsis franciscana TaxID=2886352 RepID=UPI0002FD196A|nr:hypothetical protein [Allocoleopsis franciscana]
MIHSIVLRSLEIIKSNITQKDKKLRHVINRLSGMGWVRNQGNQDNLALTLNLHSHKGESRSRIDPLWVTTGKVSNRAQFLMTIQLYEHH